MTDWTCQVTVTGTLTDEQINTLTQELPQGAVAHIEADRQRISIRLAVEADTVAQAGPRALTTVTALLPLPVIGLTIQTYADLEHEIGKAQIPPLVGIQEISKILGVSKQRASQLARENSTFPHPVTTLATGPIFLSDHITTWNEHRHTTADRG